MGARSSERQIQSQALDSRKERADSETVQYHAVQDPNQPPSHQWSRHSFRGGAAQGAQTVHTPSGASHKDVVDLTGSENLECPAVRPSSWMDAPTTGRAHLRNPPVSNQVGSSSMSAAPDAAAQRNHSVNTALQYNHAMTKLATAFEFLKSKYVDEKDRGVVWNTETEDERQWRIEIFEGVSIMTNVLQERIGRIKTTERMTGTVVNISKDELRLSACRDIMASLGHLSQACLTRVSCRQSLATAAQRWADDACCPNKELAMANASSRHALANDAFKQSR